LQCCRGPGGNEKNVEQTSNIWFIKIKFLALSHGIAFQHRDDIYDPLLPVFSFTTWWLSSALRMMRENNEEVIVHGNVEFIHIIDI